MEMNLSSLSQGLRLELSSQVKINQSEDRRRVYKKMVGACGFEPQTPTVSILKPTCSNVPLNNT